MKALNYGVFGPGASNANLQQRRILSSLDPVNGPLMANVDAHDDSGWERYNGMLLSLTRRAARGFSLGANYTVSHCVGLPGQQLPNVQSGWTDPNNPEFDKGNCETDRRHILTLSGSYELPTPEGATLRAIASGWRVSGAVRAASGTPLNIVAGQDRALSGVNAAGASPTQRVNVVPGQDPYLNKSGLNYLNPAAFALPPLGTLGNYERNSLYGPNRWSIDAALARVIRFAGTHNVELRVEAFNLTNRFMRNIPVVNFSQTTTFGTIAPVANSGNPAPTGAGDPRIMQFGIKYTF